MLGNKKVLIGLAALLFCLPAFGAEEIAPVASVALPKAMIKCPGVTSIPFTADADQALPLNVVGSLSCGEVVSVLADNEGYTAHIRTGEGKDGYVARMYLVEAHSVPAPPTPHDTEATPVNGAVRWSAGAPGCDEFLSHGRHVESITANGITVQVSLQDTGWKYRANIAVSNTSSSNVDVTPGIITADELQPNLRTLLATDSKVIARTLTHQSLWTLANAVPSPSAVSSGASLDRRLAFRSSPVQDYLNSQITVVSDHPGAFERTESVDVEALALKYVSLAPGQNTAGVMWFGRDAGARELSVRVPVGDVVFDFAFAFDQKK